MQISDRPLLRASLVRRYKRFLADVVLDSGETLTCTCPNTGSMMGLAGPGSTVWLSVSDSQTRKYPHTWELVEVTAHGRSGLVGLNTGRPNRLVEEAIQAGQIAELSGYANLKREQKYGQNSRIDLLLEDDTRPPCYVEVKNVTLLRQPGLAEFPDAVTARGAKHLDELAAMVAAGARAVMVYLVQRTDADRFGLAADIDPAYVAAWHRATEAGVETLALACNLSPDEISCAGRLPLEMPVRAK